LFQSPAYGGWALVNHFLYGLMADETLLNKIHELSDLELAALICLIAEEHCIINTVSEALDDLVQELELVCPCSLMRLLPGANDIEGRI
jgi:hypothetical protein